MGASGSAWIKPTKRRGLSPERMRDVPHPRTIRRGQRFFALHTSTGPRATVRVIKPLVSSGRCLAGREDAEGRTVTLSIDRLLATSEDGSGTFYRFVGFIPNSTYQTHALVARIEPPWARLVVPEWHPRIVITIAAAELPSESREAGCWLACRANLGAAQAVEVAPTRLRPAARDFEPGLYPTPTPDEPAAAPDDGPTPASGPGCGDIVLYPPASEVGDGMSDGLYLPGHHPPAVPGGRAYLYAHGRVTGWREVRSVQRLPNGARVELAAGFHACTVPHALPLPSSGIVSGEHGMQLWRWRSWARTDELLDPSDVVPRVLPGRCR